MTSEKILNQTEVEFLTMTIDACNEDIRWCDRMIEKYSRNPGARDTYEKLKSNAQYGIRLAERRMKELKTKN